MALTPSDRLRRRCPHLGHARNGRPPPRNLGTVHLAALDALLEGTPDSLSIHVELIRDCLRSLMPPTAVLYTPSAIGIANL
jgi:hypothetical protein